MYDYGNFIPNSIAGHGGPVPDYVPENGQPLNVAEHMLENAVTYRNRRIEAGKNMFVSLVTGQYFVGRVLRVDNDHITVGQSDPIADVLVESAREV